MKLNEIIFCSFLSLDTQNYRFEGHKHDTYEINIILDGNMEVTVGEDTFMLFPGDALIWNANLYHYNKVGNEEHAEFVTVHFKTDERISEEMLPIRHRFTLKKMFLINLFISEAKTHGTDPDSPAISLLEAIVKICLCKTEAPEFSNDTSATIYGKVVRLMATHSVRTLPTIPEMAELCGVSETTLKNAFKQQTGKSIMKYYNEMKIQYAKDMLRQGLSAEKVAKYLSFSSTSYFSQFFKHNTGMSVREFLSRNKSAD